MCRLAFFGISLHQTLPMIRLYIVGFLCVLLSIGSLHAQSNASGSDQNRTELFRKGNYFLGSGALFNNYLGTSEEVWSLSISGQTGYFHRDRFMLGTDLRVRADYLRATRKFNKETFAAESTWFMRYYFGRFFPQVSLGIANGFAIRTGLGLGYHWQIADQLALVPVYNRFSRNLNRNPGPVRNAFDQPVPSGELQLGLVYFFKP